MIKGFKNNFLDIAKTNTKINYVNTLSPGCYIHANYKNIGMSVLGDKRKKAEDVGKECAEKLKEEIESMAEIDSYTTDQLLIYLAMKGSGKIKTSRITNHILTNVQTIEKFIDVKFKIKDNIITCEKN